MAVSFSPVVFCSDCVDRITSYFKDEEMEIEEIRKLVTLFLHTQRLYYFDHVTLEAFNDRAMKRGGSTYNMPLSMACLRDEVEEGSNIYEELAGKEVVCAAFSTGVILRTNNSQTHKQLLEDNVDPNLIRSGCSCLKSDEWLKNRATIVRKIKKTKKMMSWDSLFDNKIKRNWEDDDEQEYVVSEEKEVDDDFRPGNLLAAIRPGQDCTATSSCLALCRHDSSCLVNETNKARVLHSLMLLNSKNGVTIVLRPNSCLIFSIGATVYEALARQCGDNANAKVYTTVHTMVAPLSAARTAPACNLENSYGFYKTFRIPGNFSGRYSDTSIGWRSELYPRILSSAAITECRGGKKSHDSLLKADGFVAWPRSKPITVKGGIVYDDSGDTSGNYLTNGSERSPSERIVVTAQANVTNRTAALQNIKSETPADCVKLLEEDLETMVVHLSNNLKGFHVL